MRDRRVAYILIFMLIVLAVTAAVLGFTRDDGVLPFIASGVFLVAAAVSFFRYSRCPNCKKQMGLRDSLGDACPHCKKPI